MLLTADASSSSEEARFLRLLETKPKPTGFRSISASFPQSFFPALLDEFTHDGPNGTHLCLVTEPLGLNLG
ncbi:hypothetical protein FN846DRAFT_785594 [Sphaerosporella brunnea]|uniref:Uncharacterized protein n=1 Tax=Sphaerosporella brunnea TaxID=1250544 RepID=A0A5J5EIV1_9PEZI|nr:hypothetical protein FN846DRAFT_785594 [Sphaerosporella brunnea]